MLHPRRARHPRGHHRPDVMAMQTMLFLKPAARPGRAGTRTASTPHTPTRCAARLDRDRRRRQRTAPCGSPRAAAPSRSTRRARKSANGSATSSSRTSNTSKASPTPTTPTTCFQGRRQIRPGARQREAGAVVFFNGHVLAPSKQNWSKDRFRRSFVSHYANARSFTQWGPTTPKASTKTRPPA